MAPSKLPWDLIRVLVTETYGGKIDDEGDFQQLTHLVNTVFTPAAFEENHQLAKGAEGRDAEVYTEGDGSLTVPSGTRMQDFMQWVNNLPEREPPTYLSLPANAEKLLLVGHGRSTIENVARITGILEEGEQLMAETEAET